MKISLEFVFINFIIAENLQRDIVKLGRHLLLVLVSLKNSLVALRQSLQRATVDMTMEEVPEIGVHELIL